jgi:hypothetical protein
MKILVEQQYRKIENEKNIIRDQINEDIIWREQLKNNNVMEMIFK